MVYKYDQLQRLKSSQIAGQTNVFSTVSYDANGNIQTLKRANGDNYNYSYFDTQINRLKNVADLSEYTYDKIGNLLTSTEDGSEIDWNVYGKVAELSKSGANLWCRYDAAGNRSAKIVGDGNNFITTHYVRDATGNIMATYKSTKPDELNLYGSSRLGTKFLSAEEPGKLVLGLRKYELSNHLGNVLAVISDRKLLDKADVLSVSDYYPFGLEIAGRSWKSGDYRFGFNGKENDKDFGTGIQDYGFRLYDRRIGKFLSVDPLTKEFPWNSTYAFAENDVIRSIDLEGREKSITILDSKGEEIKVVDFYDIEEGAHGSLGYGKLVFYADGSNRYFANGKTYRYTGELTGNEFIQNTIDEINDSKSFLTKIASKKIEPKIKDFQPAEKYVLRRNPYSAYESKQLKELAEDVTYKSSDSPTVDDIVGGAHNGKADAIRHAFWSALMTAKIGKDFAKQIGTAHEQDRPEQPLGEKLMDLHNNKVGRSIGRGRGTLQRIYNSVIDQAASENLLIYDTSSDKTSSFVLSEKEVKALKSINIMKHLK